MVPQSCSFLATASALGVWNLRRHVHYIPGRVIICDAALLFKALRMLQAPRMLMTLRMPKVLRMLGRNIKVVFG